MLRLPNPALAQALCTRAQQIQPALIAELISLSQIPAPTFAEGQRARYLKGRLVPLVDEVQIDAAGNVVALRRGSAPGPRLALVAHLDTVFPAETDLTVKVDGEILRGPGIGDNTASLVSLLWLAELLQGVDLGGELYLVGTVGEEGLGDLRGIRQFLADRPGQLDYVIAVDGSLGGLVRQGVGSRRFRLKAEAEGGHSWGAFGAPSAIHGLARLISRISELPVPSEPKTTYNIGLISGGTSVNTIAAEATATLDLRSLDAVVLARLEERVRQLAHEVATQSRVRLTFELVGDRPAGQLSPDHLLCQTVRKVHALLGVTTRVYPSSTDANLPLALGIPAVTIGVTTGGNGHRLDEYINTGPLAKGLQQLLLLLLALQGQ